MNRARALQKQANADFARAQEAVDRQNAKAKKAAHELAIALKLQKHPDPDANDVFISVLREKAPKLLDERARIDIVRKLAYRRNPSSWEPKIKGREALFVSLCEHLFCKFQTPRFIWSVFDLPDTPTRQRLIPIATGIAKGDSLFQMVKTGEMPVPMTRKMCHLFTTLTKYPRFIQAIRAAQLLTLGANNRLVKAVTEDTRLGKDLDQPSLELFHADFMQWLVANPMLESSKIDPILDYILRVPRVENPNYAMTGRSPLALLRDMEKWHEDLRRENYGNHRPGFRAVVYDRFKPSGFYNYTNDLSTNKNTQIWKIREILTGKELREEGGRMHHCVYSYASMINDGHVSIWSLIVTRNDGDYSVLTMEVRNSSKQIVQVRGVCNRVPTVEEKRHVQAWAQRAGLIYS